jgi:hypothetical protein
MNVVVLVWSFDLKTVTESGVLGCPVTVHNPPFDPTGWSPGLELVVCGTVRRRFFRTGSATQSRTEVVAEAVVPASRRKAASAAISRAVAACNAA